MKTGEGTSKEALHIPSDIIMQFLGPGWLLYNVFTRTALVVDEKTLALMQRVRAGAPIDEQEACKIWDVGYFSNYDGLLADPTRILWDPARWPAPECLHGAAALKRLVQAYMVVGDAAAYRARFRPKANLLDKQRFGNFHQQLGQELLLNRRENPDEWWLKQKFTDGFADVREDNLYGAVQHSYLKGYFSRRLSPGASVVDVGCGPGFYTNLMAETAKDVLGVDPNDMFLDIARKKSNGRARFEKMDVGTVGGLDAIPSASADVVFMSDALLFYFVAERPTQQADIGQLLSDIRRILRPGGVFISVEPHYLFWLAHRLGGPDAPFTVMTEYAEQNFRVTPSMSRLIQSFGEGGFAVRWMEELMPKDSFRAVDERAHSFARQFPQWQLLELVPLGK